MQRLEVSGAVRPIYGSLGVKRLTIDGVEKAIGTFFDRVSVVLPQLPGMQIAPFPRRVMLSSEACLAESQFFPALSHKHRYLWESSSGHKMCALTVCTDLYETFSIVRRTFLYKDITKC